MAYGGPSMNPPAMIGAVPGSSNLKQVKLERESELRIEVSDEDLKLRVVNGTAEIFGSELPPGIWRKFPPRLKFAVFTWYGATIEMDGVTETDYTADETPMVSYVNVHAILDARRRFAKASTSTDSEPVQGPRVIVVGPTDSGKSTLTKMLLSWAAKQGWKPTFVDLDVGQGSITIPGAIAATPIEMPLDPVEGFPLDMALVYYFGHSAPITSVNNNTINNVELYKVLVKELAQVLETQVAGNPESRAAGMVINTMGWIDGVGYELLLHAIDTFKASVVLVLGQEKLFSMLKDVLRTKSNVDVVKLHKSGGVVARSGAVRKASRASRIKEYFYGPSNELSPYANTVSFSDVQVFRIGGGPRAPTSALPIGSDPVSNPLRVTPVNIDQGLLHSILGVSYAEEPDQIISSNVSGFVHVTEVDMHRNKITYLAPSPGALPSKFLVAGSLSLVDEGRR
ncbi:unnamed protein product [Microthlaspi erraticum]|uniref:Protein CLP1 homolog n=1 Tax=Microthlaspi erraticum TaxID=1685480 RepID=A0A6D2JJC9_9BRAS|nr:unnamed protein product [Microthlaspi erraticum]